MKLSCAIRVNNLLLNFASSVEIQSAWETVTDQATITLPSRGLLNREGQESQQLTFENEFAAGDPVEILLGYNGNNQTEYTGFVASIEPGPPFRLLCEDHSYILKRQGTITTAFTGSLKELLEKYLPAATLSDSIPAIRLENFVLKNATRLQVLQKIKDNYGLAAYYRGKTLFVGLPYTETGSQERFYNFQKNIISDSLKYIRADDVKLKIKAISLLQDNTKLEIETGDADGELRTLYTYGQTSTAALKAWADDQISRLKYDGYKGDFTAFGLPFCQHGDAAVLTDPKYRERAGEKYVVNSVATSWGQGGFRRKIELGKKL